MILLLIAILATVFGMVLLCKSERFESLGGTLTIIGGVVTFIIIMLILLEHIGVSARIEKKRIEYESLCDRYEIVTSEYEDVSKSDVIKDIAEWNQEVYSYKYWAYNPWTSLFYSRRLADELKMIDRAKNTNSIVEH